MLSLQDTMVIYTTPSLVPSMVRLRAHAIDRTRVVPMMLSDTRMARSYPKEFWDFQHSIDPERRIHVDYRLYWIWNDKTELLTRVVNQNPFNSTFFAWVDIGYFR